VGELGCFGFGGFESMAHKLKNIKISWISLVSDPANEKGIIYKSKYVPESKETKVVSIAKADNEKHLIYGIVYSPDDPDAHDESANGEEIEKACHRFSEDFRQWAVDTEHNELENMSTVVENYILKGTHSILTEAKEGSWIVVIKVRDVEIWDAVKSGEITGISMAGLAEKVEVEKTKDTAEEIKSFIKSFFKSKDMTEEEEMKPEDIAKAVKAGVDAALEPVNKRLEALEKGTGDEQTGTEKKEERQKGNEETVEKSSTDDIAKLKADIEELKKSSAGRQSGSQDRNHESGDGEEDELDIF